MSAHSRACFQAVPGTHTSACAISPPSGESRGLFSRRAVLREGGAPRARLLPATGSKGSFYLRLVSIPREIPYELPSDYEMTLGRGTVLIPGDEVVVLGYGPVLLPEAWHAVHSLARSHGKQAKLVNLPWLNRIDADWLRETVGDARCVVTLDNHYISGGQGEMIAAAA